MPTLRKKSLAFMREQSKYNFRCATHFFGEISRIGIKSALNSRYPDNCPNGHNPESTQSRMDTITNGHHLEWTQSRMDTIPNGHNPEWTPSRMDTIPNGHNPEWTQSRMDTIPNEHLQLYNYFGV